jgi:hypothetical protein
VGAAIAIGAVVGLALGIAVSVPTSLPLAPELIVMPMAFNVANGPCGRVYGGHALRLKPRRAILSGSGTRPVYRRTDLTRSAP